MIDLSGKNHELAEDLKQVHDIVDHRFKLRKSATADEKKAKKMEKYLREFKRLGTSKMNEAVNDKNSEINLSLEEQAMQQIAQSVGAAIGVGQIKGYDLFRIRHQAYNKGSKILQGADDIFELELATLLQKVGEKAIQNPVNISMGVGVVGGETGNVSSKGLKDLEKALSDGIVKDISQTIVNNAESLTEKVTNESEIITRPVARSAKVDVTGYNTSWTISADIQPIWEDFIKTFTGVKCTVKNYSSDSTIDTIHLGNSDLYKVFYGTMTDTLNIKPRSAAVHTYFHSIYSDNITDEDVAPHILHLRFIYELTGGGLYTVDEFGKEHRLDSADFFIYNDPVTENIYVRSTKSMIAQFINSKEISGLGNPLHSNIAILKSKFN